MATEKRLIYLEDAIAKIVDTPSAIAERLSNCEYGYYQNPDMLVDRQHEIIDLLMDVPTVDAVEVVHGHWIEHEWAEEENGLLISNFECSACHGWERNKSDYCPNCGAKMDLEVGNV